MKMDENEPQTKEETPSTPPNEQQVERRQFLRKGLRRAAYAAPVVMLLKPPQAIAGSGGSLITPG